jgi:hypothetical protein
MLTSQQSGILDASTGNATKRNGGPALLIEQPKYESIRHLGFGLVSGGNNVDVPIMEVAEIFQRLSNGGHGIPHGRMETGQP